MPFPRPFLNDGAGYPCSHDFAVLHQRGRLTKHRNKVGQRQPLLFNNEISVWFECIIF